MLKFLLHEMARSLRRNRGTFAAVVLTLAVGVAVNTSLLSLVHSMLLAPVPFPDPERLVVASIVRRDWRPGDFDGLYNQSYLNHLDLQKSLPSLSHYAVYFPQSLSWTQTGAPRETQAAGVTEDFFGALGLGALRGRLPTPDEIRTLQPVAVVSHRFWQQALQGDERAVGRTLQLNNRPYEIIGVMPPRATLPLHVDLWVPLELSLGQRTNRGNLLFPMVGRLRPGATFGQLQAELDAASDRLARDYPASNADWRNIVQPLAENLLGNNGRAVLTLQAGSLLLLVMAMFNLATLLYAQAAQRAQETAVRLALGASTRHLVGDSLLSTYALVVPGVTLGLLGAWYTLPLLGAINPVPNLAYFFEEQNLRWDVALVSAGLALGLAALAALLPAWQQLAANTAEVLRDNTRGGGVSPAVLRTQRWLMQAQLAFTTVLLFAACVIGLSYRNLRRIDLGFALENRTAFTLALPPARYRSVEDYHRFARRLNDELNAQPWLRHATVTSNLPFAELNWSSNFAAEPTDLREPEIQVEFYSRIDETHFATLGIPLLRGRNFTVRDTLSAPPVAIVNEAFARKYWPGADPVGQRLLRRRAGEIETLEVVGVVANVVVSAMRGGLRPVVYIPVGQTAGSGFLTAVIESDLPPARVIQRAGESVWKIDPLLPLTNTGPLGQLIERQLGLDRFQSHLLAGLGVLGLLISLIGLFGLISRIITARETELAVRTALGATPGDLMRMLLWQLGRLVLTGTAAGLFAAWVLTRRIDLHLFGVSAANPLPYLAVAGLVLLLSLLSLIGPFRRASRADPARTLRA